MTEAEIGVTPLQAEESQGLPATTSSWERQGRILPYRFVGAWPCQHRDFWPPELRDNTFLLFQATGLWFFVTAALGNRYRDDEGVEHAGVFWPQ